MSGRYSRRFGRRYYSRSRRRSAFNSSRSKRRAIGNYRAALQQRDATQVNISIPSSCQVSYKEIAIDGYPGQTIHAGTYALNIWDLLRKSEFYRSYANMYDQVKIERIRVKLTPLKFYVTNENLYSSYTVVSAWDRSGLSEEQLRLVHTVASDASQSVIGTAANSDGLYINMSAQEIGTYSSAVTKNINANSNSSLVRYLYPTTIQEKSLYINTSDIDAWYEGFDGSKGRYWGIRRAEAVTGNGQQVDGHMLAEFPLSVIDSKAVDKNPAFLLESPNNPWKPTLLIGVVNENFNEDGVEFLNDIKFSLEADIGVTFRGLRKASIVAGKTLYANYTHNGDYNIKDENINEVKIKVDVKGKDIRKVYNENGIYEIDEGLIEKAIIHVNTNNDRNDIEDVRTFTNNEWNYAIDINANEGYELMRTVRLFNEIEFTAIRFFNEYNIEIHDPGSYVRLDFNDTIFKFTGHSEIPHWIYLNQCLVTLRPVKENLTNRLLYRIEALWCDVNEKMISFEFPCYYCISNIPESNIKKLNVQLMGTRDPFCTFPVVYPKSNWKNIWDYVLCFDQEYYKINLIDDNYIKFPDVYTDAPTVNVIA